PGNLDDPRIVAFAADKGFLSGFVVPRDRGFFPHPNAPCHGLVQLILDSRLTLHASLCARPTPIFSHIYWVWAGDDKPHQQACCRRMRAALCSRTTETPEERHALSAHHGPRLRHR